MTYEQAVLLLALKAVGEEWADNYVPAQVFSRTTYSDLLLSVDQMVWEPNSGITAETIQQHAPVFHEQFGLIALRELGKPFGHPREVVGAALNG